MDLFRIVNTCADAPFIYVSMDNVQASGCVGHWIWECALFLPYIKDIQKNTTKPIKILLSNKKRYKTNILSDFGFYESDIEYSPNMEKDDPTDVHKMYVSPVENEYLMYVPKFFYLVDVSIHTTNFFDALNLFRNFYINSLPPIKKTIPIVYVARSKKENFIYNTRNFVNNNEFCDMVNRNNIYTLDVDTLSSLKPQFETILNATTIILEMGSAFTINAASMATNSHIIILNNGLQFDYWKNNTIILIFKKLMSERNNTVEAFNTTWYQTNPGDFSVNIKHVEDRIKSIKLLRLNCVVCNSSDFETINSFPKFPIMAISNNSVKDEYYDYTPISCTKCNCLQLQNLVDPNVLYSDIYMNSTFSPSWTDHHIHFSKFILDSTDETTFLEVGANKGDLYKLMIKERSVDFITLDMWKHKDLPSEIKYIEGNCETFDFKGFNTIILSHVFEHLYEPLVFIKNIKNAEVSTVFISIPNFDLLVKEKSLLVINSQHTFHCGFDYITYMFSLFNYKCDKYYTYNGNFESLMFKFVIDNDMVPVKFPSVDIQLYKEIYVNKVNTIGNIVIPPNSYIAPSGIYGQFYYSFMKNKHNVIGFLDNNPQRHNNYLYGTDKLVYLPSTIDYSNATVFVCDCYYKDEIIMGLKKICESVNIVCI